MEDILNHIAVPLVVVEVTRLLLAAESIGLLIPRKPSVLSRSLIFALDATSTGLMVSLLEGLLAIALFAEERVILGSITRLVDLHGMKLLIQETLHVQHQDVRMERYMNLCHVNINRIQRICIAQLRGK